MEGTKKENRSHPIPKNQQMNWTPSNQLLATYLFLEGKSYNKITGVLNALTKRELRKRGVKLNEIRTMEGRAIERKVCRLFKGFVNIKDKRLICLPSFDSLPNRTGRPLHKNERRCFGIAIKWKRSLNIISRLTGRSIEEVRKERRKIIKESSKNNKKSLFDNLG